MKVINIGDYRSQPTPEEISRIEQKAMRSIMFGEPSLTADELSVFERFVLSNYEAA